MKPQKTALILIGFQNDYFSKDGILRRVVEESSKVTGILSNTLHLIKDLEDVLIIATYYFFRKLFRTHRTCWHSKNH